jgi:hypothetical protein
MINEHKIENVLFAIDKALDTISLGDYSKDRVRDEVVKTLQSLKKVELLETMRKEGK